MIMQHDYVNQEFLKGILSKSYMKFVLYTDAVV